jgi:hypothetical protein
MRKPTTRALKYGTTFKNLRDTTALQGLAGLFLPGVNQKTAAING